MSTLTLSLPAFVTTKSNLPSPLKSAVFMESGSVPAAKLDGALRETDAIGLVITKKATLDVPPPGVGLTTVTEAVLALAMSDARTLAISFESLTKVVARAAPFHLTVDPDTNPVPLSVSVKAAPPGTTASGLKGWLMKGTADAGGG